MVEVSHVDVSPVSDKSDRMVEVSHVDVSPVSDKSDRMVEVSHVDVSPVSDKRDGMVDISLSDVSPVSDKSDRMVEVSHVDVSPVSDKRDGMVDISLSDVSPVSDKSDRMVEVSHVDVSPVSDKRDGMVDISLSDVSPVSDKSDRMVEVSHIDVSPVSDGMMDVISENNDKEKQLKSCMKKINKKKCRFDEKEHIRLFDKDKFSHVIEYSLELGENMTQDYSCGYQISSKKKLESDKLNNDIRKLYLDLWKECKSTKEVRDVICDSISKRFLDKTIKLDQKNYSIKCCIRNISTNTIFTKIVQFKVGNCFTIGKLDINDISCKDVTGHLPHHKISRIHLIGICNKTHNKISLVDKWGYGTIKFQQDKKQHLKFTKEKLKNCKTIMDFCKNYLLDIDKVCNTFNVDKFDLVSKIINPEDPDCLFTIDCSHLTQNDKISSEKKRLNFYIDFDLMDSWKFIINDFIEISLTKQDSHGITPPGGIKIE